MASMARIFLEEDAEQQRLGYELVRRWRNTGRDAAPRRRVASVCEAGSRVDLPGVERLTVMTDERNARRFFALTSIVVGFGLVLQLVLVIAADPNAGAFESTPARIINYFSFFTVQSNILVAGTTGLLAQGLHRRSTLFSVLRLDAVLCIAVTGVVFHLALASLQELTGWDLVADFILHTLSPVLCALGWLSFGPRDRLTRQIVGLAVLAPLGWLGYALVYGAVAKDRDGNDYYAYPFMNVHTHGYAVAVLRCALVAVLFLGLAFSALALDRRLPGVRRTDTVAGAA